jgi:lysozyme family protein
VARTINSEREYYSDLWNRLTIKPECIDDVDYVIKRMLKGRARYESVCAKTGVPWYVIGIIHTLECDANFSLHLHNGDPLSARTVQVPAGRPKTGNPPFGWEESALDALAYDGLSTQKDWSIEAILFALEAYNGFGYRRRKINSPYLFSMTNQYSAGKFTADGVYDAKAVSLQVGAAAILHKLVADGTIASFSQILIKRGDVGKNVADLQKLLNTRSTLKLTVDGEFGPLTEQAVKLQQSKLGLPINGIVDAKMYAMLTAKTV